MKVKEEIKTSIYVFLGNVMIYTKRVSTDLKSLLDLLDLLSLFKERPVVFLFSYQFVVLFGVEAYRMKVCYCKIMLVIFAIVSVIISLIFRSCTKPISSQENYHFTVDFFGGIYIN